MTKLSELFGRRDLGSPLERLADGGLKDIAERAAAEIAAAEQDSEIGARLGEENEALRNLLLEAGRKITEIEEFKESFINILDPANRALQALEQEKTANLSFRRTLSQLRSEHEILQTRFFEIEKRSASLEGANAHLRQDYSSVLQTARDYKTSSEELHNELSVERAAKADIDRLFAQLTAQADALGDENQRLRAQGIETESALGKIEAEYSAAKERLAFFESDNQSQQRSLEQTSNEVSRLSQRLTDNESALAAARARVLQLEANLSDVETERNRLTAQLNEISDRTRRESGKLTMQIEAMQTRTVMAEKLLASTRQLLVSRSEEARISDRKALDSKHARDAAEKRVSEVEAWLRAREEQIRDIEQTRSALQERGTSQANHLKLRESQLAEIEEKLQSADDRTGQLETEIKVIRMTYERRIEEMNTTLDHARLEQKVAEGALEAARRDRAQLQREISKLRGALRRGVLAEDPSEPSTREPDAQELLRNLDRDINAA